MQPQDKSEIDTSIAPTGGVQEKASAFSTPKVHFLFSQISEQRIVSITFFEGQISGEAELPEDQEEREQFGV